MSRTTTTPLPCINLGEVDTSCKCRKRVKYHCRVWKKCTLEPVGSAVMNCVRCRAEGRGYAPLAVDPGTSVPDTTTT